MDINDLDSSFALVQYHITTNGGGGGVIKLCKAKAIRILIKHHYLYALLNLKLCDRIHKYISENW
jgi:hypothetical protein